MARSFDAYPYILLNLVLACLTVLQAPFIMMSRQAARDRAEAEHDYEVNAKAELEIAALRAQLDEIRDTTWAKLIKTQQRQLEMLAELASHRTEC